MHNKNKQNTLKAVLLSIVMLGSNNVFADSSLVPGTITPCQQLYLVNDPNNPNEDPDAQDINGDGIADVAGICVDVPVNLEKARVVFNLEDISLNGKGEPVGLKHVVMVATGLKHRIDQGLIDPEDVSIVGIIHGKALQARWAFNGSPVSAWIEKIFALKNAGVNVQLEACGAATKGMQLNGARLANGMPLDEKAIYSSNNGRILVNQGAIGRIIELQQHKYAYIDED